MCGMSMKEIEAQRVLAKRNHGRWMKKFSKKQRSKWAREAAMTRWGRVLGKRAH